MRCVLMSPVAASPLVVSTLRALELGIAGHCTQLTLPLTRSGSRDAGKRAGDNVDGKELPSIAFPEGGDIQPLLGVKQH
jgi:hypothetical protein